MHSPRARCTAIKIKQKAIIMKNDSLKTDNWGNFFALSLSLSLHFAAREK
jgi:hypothetical protein